MSHHGVPTCPQCATTDMVRRVSAIVWEGHSAVSLRGVQGGVVIGAGLLPFVGASTHHGVHVTSLASALAPPPPPRPRTAGWFWLTMSAVYCAFWAVVAVSTGVAAQASPCLLPGVLVFAAVGFFLLRRRRDEQPWREAMPVIGDVWHDGWFCARCGGAFLPSPVVPEPYRDRLVSPDEFRDLVYLAAMTIRHTPQLP